MSRSYGREPCHDYLELKLSDAFKDIEGLKLAETVKMPLELTVHVYNINDGHNPEIHILLITEYDRDMDIAVNRREARE